MSQYPSAFGERQWAEDAACRGLPLEMFFLDCTDRRSERKVREARAVCRSCPVRLDCAQHALSRPERFGVWGGLTPGERHRIRRSRAALWAACAGSRRTCTAR